MTEEGDNYVESGSTKDTTLQVQEEEKASHGACIFLFVPVENGRPRLLSGLTLPSA